MCVWPQTVAVDSRGALGATNRHPGGSLAETRVAVAADGGHRPCDPSPKRPFGHARWEPERRERDGGGADRQRQEPERTGSGAGGPQRKPDNRTGGALWLHAQNSARPNEAASPESPPAPKGRKNTGGSGTPRKDTSTSWSGRTKKPSTTTPSPCPAHSTKTPKRSPNPPAPCKKPPCASESSGTGAPRCGSGGTAGRKSRRDGPPNGGLNTATTPSVE